MAEEGARFFCVFFMSGTSSSWPQGDKEEMRQQKEEVEKTDAEIDEQVYEDTKDQHIEKHRLDNEIDEVQE